MIGKRHGERTWVFLKLSSKAVVGTGQQICKNFIYIGGWVIGCKCTRDEYGRRSVVKSTECISTGGELHSKHYSWMT